MRTKTELEKLHTKQLLHRLRCTYTLAWDYSEEELEDFQKERSIIKEILATRPHVMNKQESKAYRKMKIKKGEIIYGCCSKPCR